MALLRGTGMRQAKVVALDLSDYDPTTGALTVRSGKGRKDRIVYAPTGARSALDDWIAVRGNAAGPLFYGLVKGGGWRPRRWQSSVPAARKRLVSRRSLRTTCGRRSSVTYSTPAPTLQPSSA
jgi:integrase